MAKKAKDKNPDDDRRGAKTKSGRPCRHTKGFRTDHPGSGRCYRHGGASPNGNSGAGTSSASSSTPWRRLGNPATCRASSSWRSDYSASMPCTASGSTRSARHAKLTLDAGVEERKVRIAEAQGELLAGVIKAILGDLGLNKKQQTDAPAIGRRHLLALAG